MGKTQKKTKPVHVNGPKKKGTSRKKRKVRAVYKQARYDDAKRFAAITLAKQTNPHNAAVVLGLPPQTVDAWVKGFRCAESLQLWEQSRGQLAQACHVSAWDLLASTNAKIDDAPLNHIMTGFKVMLEAERLLRGQPTAINANEKVASVSDLRRLSPEQQAALRELINIARGNGPQAEPARQPGTDARQLTVRDEP